MLLWLKNDKNGKNGLKKCKKNFFFHFCFFDSIFTPILFKGKALYYERKVLNPKIREIGQGDVIIMNTIDGAVAFVTSGFCNFCKHHEVYLTNFKDVRLIQYDREPTFNAGKETKSSLQQNLALRKQISKTLNKGSSN